MVKEAKEPKEPKEDPKDKKQKLRPPKERARFLIKFDGYVVIKASHDSELNRKMGYLMNLIFKTYSQSGIRLQPPLVVDPDTE